MLVTESGFPEGKLSLSGGADPTRFIQLAIIYSNFTNTDSVRECSPAHTAPGTVEAAAVPVTPGSTDVLPIISIAGLSDSRTHANELTARATTALIDYVHQQQRVHACAAGLYRGHLPSLCPAAGLRLAAMSLPAISKPGYRRKQDNTFFTFPEWYIVYSFEDFGRFLDRSSESHFNYLGHIFGFWRSFCTINQRRTTER